MFTRLRGVVKKKVVTSAPLPPLPDDDDDVVLIPPPVPRSPGNVRDCVHMHKKVLRDFKVKVDAEIAERMKFIEAKDKEIAELFAKLQEAKAARDGAAKDVYALTVTKETKYNSEMNGLYKVMLDKLK